MSTPKPNPVRTMAEGGLAVVVGILQQVDQADAADAVDAASTDLADAVVAAARPDPVEVADELVNATVSTLRAIGQPVAATLVGVLMSFLERYLRTTFGVTVSGTHVEGTANLT